jgi:integrase
VTATPPATGGATVRAAVDRFLSSPRCANPNTRRAYATALEKWAASIGAHRVLADVGEDEAADALAALWGASAPGTWNQRRASLASFLTWCRKNRIAAPNLPESAERRPDPADETRAIPQTQIERLLSRRDVPLREKTLWRMLYETAARASEILALNIEVLDLERRRAPIRSKGGASEYVYWSTGTARLLPRLIAGRTKGPLFLSERRPAPARMPRAEDLCPETGRARLGYDRARVLLDHYTSPGTGRPGWDLHQLRHSAATTLGEKGTPLQLIMAKTRHRNPRTAMRYVKPGGQAVAEVTELLDTAPPRR